MEGTPIALSVFVFVFMVVLIPLCGLLMAATPWLMRKNECFAVTVPESAQANPRLKALKKRYLVIMCAVTVACTALCVAGFGLIESNTGLFIFLYLVAALAPEAAGFALMLYFRRKVQELKFEESWVAPKSVQLRSAIIGEEEAEAPRPLSLLWDLLYLPIIVIAFAVPLAFYQELPDMLPIHAGFDGQVDSYAEKSLLSALFPALMDVFLAAVFLICHVTMAYSKKANEPGTPRTSEYAYGMFARAQSIFLLASGLLMCTVMTTCFLLAFFGKISLTVACIVVLVFTAPIIIGDVVLSVVYGQAGSKLFRRMRDQEELLCDDDEYWKLGIFYFNPNDPAVFLPQRFGIGWTCNYARPASWALIAGFVLLLVGVLLLCLKMQ
ncbi:MAG: DUF1648 domain-containing protein [Coriobacteriales bacterium]